MLWNFFIVMMMCKVGLVLVVGCLMVVKFVLEMFYFVFVFVELVVCVGVLVGLLFIVMGDLQLIGGELIFNFVVCKFSFMGFIVVGCLLMCQCVDDIKKFLFELGGNVLFIVFDDVDVDVVVEGVMIVKYCNVGQICVCVNCFYVQCGIYDMFVVKLVDVVCVLCVGNGMELGVQQGLLIYMCVMDKVQQYLDDVVC